MRTRTSVFTKHNSFGLKESSNYLIVRHRLTSGVVEVGGEVVVVGGTDSVVVDVISGTGVGEPAILKPSCDQQSSYEISILLIYDGVKKVQMTVQNFKHVYKNICLIQN